MYSHGMGVTQDYAEAAKWYRKAADQGHASAQYYLGLMYYQGEGVSKNRVLAYMWVNLAAAALTGKAHEDALEFRNTIAKEMTPQQIVEAQRLALEWKSVIRKCED